MCGLQQSRLDRGGAASALCLILTAVIGCGDSSPQQSVVPPQHVVPQVPQAGGNGFAEIQPGQAVILLVSSSGLRVNEIAVETDQLGVVLSQLAERGVFATGPLTVHIQSDARVLNVKSIRQMLNERQIPHEIAEGGNAVR